MKNDLKRKKSNFFFDKLSLVLNEKKYWEFIRDLRNSPAVKKGFISQEYIPADQHENYMRSYGKKYYICLFENFPIGYVGTINNDIRVAVLPEYQGRGVGEFMINNVMSLHPSSFAKVKIKNEASIRLFEKCGFKKQYYILEKEKASS